MRNCRDYSPKTPLCPANDHCLPVARNGFPGDLLEGDFATPNMNISDRKPLELLKQDPARLVSLVHAFVHPAGVF
jgi:hypothetical protein